MENYKLFLLISSLPERVQRYSVLVFDENLVGCQDGISVCRGFGHLNLGDGLKPFIAGLVNQHLGAAGQGQQNRPRIDNRPKSASIAGIGIDPGRLSGFSIQTKQVAAAGHAVQLALMQDRRIILHADIRIAPQRRGGKGLALFFNLDGKGTPAGAGIDNRLPIDNRRGGVISPALRYKRKLPQELPIRQPTPTMLFSVRVTTCLTPSTVSRAGEP